MSRTTTSPGLHVVEVEQETPEVAEVHRVERLVESWGITAVLLLAAFLLAAHWGHVHGAACRAPEHHSAAAGR